MAGYRFDQIAPIDGEVVQRIHFFHPGTSLVFDYNYESSGPVTVLAHSQNGFVFDERLKVASMFRVFHSC